MRVIIAARLSQVRRGQTGIDTQDEDAQEWCAEHGYEVVDTIADKKSGTTAMWNRPKLRPWVTRPDLMARYDGIVAAKQDRLSRQNWRDEAELRIWAERNGKTLFIVDRNMKWPPDDEDDVSRWNDGAEQARREWVNTSRRYTRMQRSLRDNGYLVGRPVYGFRVADVDGTDHKTLVKDPAQSAVLREAADRYLAGETLDAICADFNRRAILSPADVRKDVPEMTPWYARRLGDLLRNPAIAGRRVGADGKVVLRYEGIITWDEHKRLVARLDSRAHRKGISPKNVKLLTSIIHCGTCGKPMYAIMSGGKGRYPAYYCRTGNGCKMLVAVDAADAEFTAWVHRTVVRRTFPKTTVIPGGNHQDQIDRISADMDELDKTSPDYIARLTALHAELMRVQSLPAEPDTVVTTNVSGAEIMRGWESMDTAGRRTLLLELGLKVYAIRGADDNVTLTHRTPDHLAA